MHQLTHPFVILGYPNGLLELIPALDGYVVYREGAEGIDECFGKTGIGEQGDVEVYSGTANLVSVGELTGGEVLREVPTMSISLRLIRLMRRMVST